MGRKVDASGKRSVSEDEPATLSFVAEGHRIAKLST